MRTTIVTTAVFAFGLEVIGDSETALFAAFGSFAMLAFVDLGGPRRARVSAYLCLSGVGFVLIVLGTLCSRSPWLAAATMLAVGFVILFAGVVDSSIATATVSALLLFVLPVMVPASPSDVPARLAGWALASVVSIVALQVVWPARPHDKLRASLARACRALSDSFSAVSREEASLGPAIAAVDEVRERLRSTPYQPAGATGRSAALAQLVNDVGWVAPFRAPSGEAAVGHLFVAERAAIATAVVSVLHDSALRLEGQPADPDLDRLERARNAVAAALTRHIEEGVTQEDPAELAVHLDEAFRLRLVSYGAHEIGVHAILATGGTEPDPGVEALYPGVTRVGPRRAAMELARDHLSFRSVWFRNSLRGAAGLALAVLVGQLADVQHAFWVVLGALSVLRSNALTTGSTVVRALAGTLVGIAVGGILLTAIGTETALLWLVLPPATLLAAYGPRAISFAAGQAAFSVFVLVLFQLISPTGLRVAGVRFEDIALGCVISLGVGILFWPRGAGAVVRDAVSSALTTSTEYLTATINGLLAGNVRRLDYAARMAKVAGRRLDDALAQYLAERSTARLDVDSLVALTAGAARLRWTADALRSGVVLFRLRPAQDPCPGLQESRKVLDREVEALHTWCLALSAAVAGATLPPPPPDPGPAGSDGGGRARYLGKTGPPSELAHRLAFAWTGEHLDVLRERQPRLAEAASKLARDSGLDPVSQPGADVDSIAGWETPGS